MRHGLRRLKRGLVTGGHGLLLLSALSGASHASPTAVLKDGREPPSSAAPAPDAAANDLDASIERGIELRRVGRDSEALQVFEEVYARAPQSARLRAHLAATHQALGHWLEAEQLLRAVLQAGDDPYVRRNRGAIEQSYAVVEQRVGSLDVAGAPVGAEIYLSGRRLGTLPLAGPVRVLSGSYVLEVRYSGYYSIERPVSIAGRALVRESVELVRRATAPLLSPVQAPAAVVDTTGVGWVTWALAGMGVAAGVTGGIAWWQRERHAARWNSAGCLAPGLNRGQVCAGERDAGRWSERIAVASGIAAGLFSAGAALSYSLESRRSHSATLQLTECGLRSLGLGCTGSF